jgi:hypothetical protein
MHNPKPEILGCDNEAHLTRFSIYPGSNKMYHDLKQRFWWTKMKIEIARYVA